jgi:hypothetical protein
VRTVSKLVRREKRFNGKREYFVYIYRTNDEMGNVYEISSLDEYEIGARVEVWHDDKYNMLKMRPYRKKRT